MDGKFLYFFITYKKEEKVNENDIKFVVPENKDLQPESIYVEEQYENEYHVYNKIYRVSKSAGKGENGNNYYFEFILNDRKYIITFDSKGKSFIYDIKLTFERRFIGCELDNRIDQGSNYKKLDYFIKALEKNGEKNIIDDLYKETIRLYEKKKSFVLLIILFLKIYKKKDLCNELLKIFKKMNEGNIDKEQILEENLPKIKSIITEADEIIINNNYNCIEFYGIILCYLNYYDYDTFSLVINDLDNKKPEDLYEILLIYYAHFIRPINKNSEFFNKFISYAISNKDFAIFEKGLDYIRDIETFLNIIEKNKEAIFKKYKYNDQKIENIIKIGYDINYNINKERKSIFGIIDNIKSIINFCKDENTFLIYFSSIFWIKILKNYYDEPKKDNIKFCFKLREIFKSYHDLVLKIFEKNDSEFSHIKKEVIRYLDRDEFAFVLDRLIRKYIDNKELTNIEKLNVIIKYNPYYKGFIHSHYISGYIFDCFDFNQIDNEFLENFKNINFESLFKDNIIQYIYKLLGKIKDISNFEPIIKLFNIKYIQDKNKIFFLEELEQRYNNLIRYKIGILTNEKLKEAVHIVARIAVINYIYGTQLDFINKRIKNSLNKKIISLIYIEIINLILIKGNDEEEEYAHIDFNDLKTFIFDEFSNTMKDNNDIENRIKLIDILEGKNETETNKDINEFLEKIIEKNLFTKDDFFSGKQDYRILLLCELYEKGKIKKSQEEYYGKIINLLDSIKKEIEGDIEESKLEEFLEMDKSLVIQRLKLVKLVLEKFNPEEKYEELIKRINT